MRKTIKTIIALLIGVVTILTATACGGAEPGHEHSYKDGICSCGEEKEGYFSEGLSFTKRDDGVSYAVTGFDKSAGRVIIPAEYDGLPVVEIGAEVFINCPRMSILRMPDSIKTIGEYAFYGSNIVELTIPKNVEEIGTNAFGGCLKLKKIYYNAIDCDKIVLTKDPVTNTDIGAFNESGSFDEVGDAITVYIGKDVKKLPDYLFWAGGYQYAPKITSVVFEDNSKCEKVGFYAFRDLRYIKSFTFGVNSSLKEIGYEALANMGRFQEEFSVLVIPKTVEKISKRALTMGKHSSNHALTELKFEDINGWYSVDSQSNYDLKQGGDLIDVSQLVDGSTDVFALANGKYMYKK